jgi:hypothetical protein
VAKGGNWSTAFVITRSGILQASILDEGLEALDPLHGFLRAFSQYFTTEAQQNDGMVGRYSSHLGTVIRSDYALIISAHSRRHPFNLPKKST